MSRRLGRRGRATLAAAVFAVAAATAAQTAAGPDFDHATLARQALERHIRPGYARLADAAEDFALRMEALCSAPSVRHPATALDAFAALVRAWGRIEHIRFGPATESYAHERFAFWPDPRGIGKRQVLKLLRFRDPAALAAETLAKKSVAVQGLTALEIVLFSNAGETVAETSEALSFRCRYALAMARNLATIAKTLVAGWSDSGSFAAIWLSPGADNPVYPTGMDVTRDLARALLDGLAALRDHKIAGPIGLGPGDAPPTRAAFAPSGLAIAVIGVNTSALLELFAVGGFADVFRPREPGAVEYILGELTRVRELAAGIEAAGGRDVRAPDVEEQLLRMGFPLKNARARAAELIADVAGLVMGFNDSDGN